MPARKKTPSKEITGPKLLSYLDELVDHLRKLVPKALRGNSVDAIHDARVATRRLKAAVDLLHPVLDAKRVKPFSRTLKKLRRRLGPLRDLDVIREHLGKFKESTATQWLSAEFDGQRTEHLRTMREKSTSNKTLAKLGSWWGLREQIKEANEAIEPMLHNSLKQQFEDFSRAADELHHPGSDPHAIRIAGKSLRYTFEMAQAHGLAVGSHAKKIFKRMQESLGLWHDYIVLTERMLTCSGDAQLAHHDAAKQRGILALSQVTLKRSEAHLKKFAALWDSHKTELASAINPSTPPQTDRDPSRSEETPSPAAPASDVPPNVSG